ncbi:hypothetical protein ACFTXM_45120 [Streptomyces sp. NPDC056930]|uniref:hypothetical protein n=1 Tax=Streptomyces sp. NPDC056930 TaxID=3345967 RepID=UPI0036290C56
MAHAQSSLPTDIKRQQIRTYNRPALRPTIGAAGLRQDLIRVSCLISTHPHWAKHGWSMAGRVELSRAAQSGPDGVRELVVRWTGEEFSVTEPGTRL